MPPRNATASSPLRDCNLRQLRHQLRLAPAAPHRNTSSAEAQQHHRPGRWLRQTRMRVCGVERRVGEALGIVEGDEVGRRRQIKQPENGYVSWRASDVAEVRSDNHLTKQRFAEI